ncbi:MAG: hypothetical protein PHR56_04860 [Dehalococcoidales bacterium]|nr:hypothetical protein [Dehalococcoidales bacterium]
MIPINPAANLPEARRSAYQYICDRLSTIPPGIQSAAADLIVPLEDLELLRQGAADPSPEMVALVKRILCPAASEAEIETHLVAPFQQ